MGYQTIDLPRPQVCTGRPPVPVVDIALVRPGGWGQRERRPSERLPQAIVAAIRVRRQAGASIRTIGTELAVSHTAVRRHSADIQAPEGGWAQGGVPKLARNRSFIERLRRSGFTYKEIAEEIGAPESQVYYFLNGRIHERRRGIRVCRLVQCVARVTGQSAKEMRKPRGEDQASRRQEVVAARHLVFWLVARQHPKATLKQIGRSLGGFDHASVIFGKRKINDLIAAMQIDTGGRPHIVCGRIWAAMFGEARP